MRDEWQAKIDWQAPWLRPYVDVGSVALSLAQASGSVAQGLNSATSSPRTFVAQTELTHGVAYETFIREHQAVPTRDNLHDFFNGLVWHRWPLVKSRLNELQAQAIASDGVRQHRGPLRDAITLWDENGAVLLASSELWQALIDRDWKRLFVDLRTHWEHASLWVLGHALMEQAVRPRKNLTVHVLKAELPHFANNPEQMQRLKCGDHQAWMQLDAYVADLLHADWLRTKPLTPLPIMGVPGWHPKNDDPLFYEDPQVFRPKREVLAHSCA